MTLSQQNTTHTFDVPFKFEVNVSSTKLLSNGETIIQTLQSKKNTTGRYINGILMKMRSTISKIRRVIFVKKCKKSSLLLSILLICASICITRTTAHTMKYSSNVVKTKYGELRGIVVRNNPTVEAYLGVPYATPPVGSLRYMPPVIPSAWKSTRNADTFSKVCPQMLTGREEFLENVPRERLAQIRRLLPLLSNQSEDCLYLNLYVPRTVEPSVKNIKALAAIMYIHGESFEWNSGNPYDGSILAAHGNVIVVTVNFRLGVLGFLKTGSKNSAQGNFGLMDLVAAIHWLRENLPAFNGDPNSIVLMGHGTGASLANCLIASPVVRDLVQRAILLSGSALSPWAIQKDPLYVKRKVAEHTGCHGDLVEDDLAPCLRTRSLSSLLSVQLETPRFLPGFAPFVDGTVIVGTNTNVNSSLNLPIGSAISSVTGIEMADFSKREIIFGVTSFESYLDLSAQDLQFGFNETKRDRILRTYVRNNFNYHLNEIYAALKNEYTDWERPPRNPLGSRDAVLELLSDGHTVAPLVRVGYLHSLRGGRSFFVHFNHLSNERDFPQRSGSIRGEDVPFALGLPVSPLFPHNYTLQDIKLSRTLVRYLSNFAHTGNPNESPSSFMYISQTKHNHIATPMEGINRLSKSTIEPSVKQKRQMRRSIMRKRKKRNRNFSYYDNDEDSDESEEDEEITGHNTNYNHNHNRDRLDDTNDQPYPFWDTYDTLNQYYLEIGNKLDMKNHYRGHKLSLWLNLIPQLHMPSDLNELPVRHHHFSESDPKFYDGIVRAQSMEKPIFIKPAILNNDAIITTTKALITTVATLTDCPSNTTVLPTLAATKPHYDAENKHDNRSFHLDGFLRQLTNAQFNGYPPALIMTIGFGCFLLLLNIVIFVVIYYNRIKRTLGANKKKEEFMESDINLPNYIDQCLEKSGAKSSINIHPYATNVGYDEYNHYLDRAICKGNTCGMDSSTDNHKCKSSGKETHVEFSLTPTHSTKNFGIPEKSTLPNRSKTHLHLSTYPSPQLHSSHSEPESSNSSDMIVYQCQRSNFKDSQKAHTEHCNQSTQSEFLGTNDVGTTVTENDVDNQYSSTKIDEISTEKVLSTPSSLRSSISTSNYQGGILRQQFGPTTPSTSKKRVQIQEISV